MAFASTVPARDAADAAQDILDVLRAAAMEVIAEGGLKALTLAAVGSRAGVSRGLPSYHFGSKAGLILSLLDGLLSRRLEVYGRPEGRPGLDGILDNLDRVADTFIRSPLQQQGFITLTTEGLVDSDPVIRQRIVDYNAAVHRIISERFQEAIGRSPGAAPFDAEALGSIYIATLKGIGLKWMAEQDIEHVRRAFAAFRAMLILTLRDVEPQVPKGDANHPYDGETT